MKPAPRPFVLGHVEERNAEAGGVLKEGKPSHTEELCGLAAGDGASAVELEDRELAYRLLHRLMDLAEAGVYAPTTPGRPCPRP